MFDRLARRTAAYAGRPIVFAAALASIVIWLVAGPLFGWSDTWQLAINTATTIVTFLMVFLIQSSQNRDTAALQLKLDELVRVTGAARDDLVGIEEKSEQQQQAEKIKLRSGGY
jgi:low affinity Fe/Cu permease